MTPVPATDAPVKKRGRPRGSTLEKILEDDQHQLESVEGKSVPVQEIVLDREEVVHPPTRRRPVEELFVEARVVYLGGHPTKSVYLQGSVIPIEEDGRMFYRPSDAGATSYDFSRVDSMGRIMKDRLTADGKPFAICRHIGHLLSFMEMLDEENAPQFEVRAVPKVRARIEEYSRSIREQIARDVDRGQPVLRDMGLA